MELFQVTGVVAPWNPDLQIAVRAILLVKVLDCALIMSGSVELRIIRQPVLDGATDYSSCVNEAVGFGDNQVSCVSTSREAV